jgi:hypothetical protein
VVLSAACPVFAGVLFFPVTPFTESGAVDLDALVPASTPLAMCRATGFALYWLTGTVSSSLRFYADSFREPWQPSHDREPTLHAPTGIAVFPRELSHVPRSVAEKHAA